MSNQRKQYTRNRPILKKNEVISEPLGIVRLKEQTPVPKLNDIKTVIIAPAVSPKYHQGNVPKIPSINRHLVTETIVKPIGAIPVLEQILHPEIVEIKGLVATKAFIELENQPEITKTADLELNQLADILKTSEIGFIDSHEQESFAFGNEQPLTDVVADEALELDLNEIEPSEQTTDWLELPEEETEVPSIVPDFIELTNTQETRSNYAIEALEVDGFRHGRLKETIDFGEAEFAHLPEVAVHLVTALEHAEPDHIKEVLTTMEDIAQLAQNIYELRVKGDPQAIELEQELTELSIEIFEALGIELDEEMVTAFINLIIAAELENQKTVRLAQLLEQGTHEYKVSNMHFLNRFVKLLRQKTPHPNGLGRFVLQLKAA